MDLTLFQVSQKLKKLLHKHLTASQYLCLKKFTSYIKRCIYFSIFFPIIFYLFFFNKRILNINIKRIGHLCIDVDCFIKDKILQKKSNSLRNYILPAPLSKVANKALLGYFEDYIRVVKTPFISNILYTLGQNFILTEDCSIYTEPTSSAKAYKIISDWGNRPPLFILKTCHEVKGINLFKKLGLSKDKWFVCIHSRESGYSSLELGNESNNDYGQSFRNSKIESYNLAVKKINSMGGLCFRVGDKTMTPIREQGKYFDMTKYEDDGSINIFLSTKCKMFLGNSSGAFSISAIFGIPIAAANMAPLGNVFVYGYKDISIPKLYQKKRNKKLESFFNVLQTDISNIRRDDVIQNSPYHIVDNSPEDIRDMVIELLDSIDKQRIPTESRLHKKFRNLFDNSCHSYYSKSRISKSFLKKYKFLVE